MIPATPTTVRSLATAFPESDITTLPATDFIPETVQISRRELSLIIERLLMAAGSLPGMWQGDRDYVLETVAVAGSSAIEALEAALIEQADAERWPTATLLRPNELEFTGAAAILVGNTISNALLAHLALLPDTPFIVRGLSRLAGSDGLHVRASFHGFALEIERDAAAGQLTITASACAPNTGADPVQLLRDGLELSGAQWWRIYQPSNFALSQETEVSRAHTGVSETLLHYSV